MQHLRAAKAAREAGRALARRPHILDDFAADIAAAGLVGESRIARTLYLVLVSRLLSTPASAWVHGPSSGGKSHTVKLVLSFFPDAAFVELSSVSPKALLYMDESLEHRTLVIAEASGFRNDFADYLLRTLLSEHRIRHATVESTSDGFRGRPIEKSGPTGLIFTSTQVAIHPENATRMLSLAVLDSPQQTRDVLVAQALDGKRDVVSRRRWIALQRELERAAGTDPAVPYAAALATAIPQSALAHPRMRRDFATVLTLVRAHALLHCASRSRDEHGRIVASVDDYAVVRDLINDVIGHSLGRTVEPDVRETVEAVRAERKSAKRDVQVTAVAAHLGLDKGTASRRVRKAITAGYLRNVEERRGRPARLVANDAMPDDERVLPDPSVVADAA